VDVVDNLVLHGVEGKDVEDQGRCSGKEAQPRSRSQVVCETCKPPVQMLLFGCVCRGWA
jgi:hypothetical protein